MLQSLFRNFGGSLALALAGLALAGTYGWNDSHAIAPTLDMVWTVVVLAVLEISLSCDNAVVNAAVLETMAPVWQRRFLTWGMVFAVFGTRVLFPLLIVGVAARIGPIEAVQLSLADPQRYEALVTHAHVGIAGFGGAFLLLVGLGFFLDTDKTVHWLTWLEKPMARAADIKAAEIAVTLAALLGIASALPGDAARRLLVAGVTGIVAFIAVEGLGHWLSAHQVAAPSPDAPDAPGTQGAASAQTLTRAAAQAGIGAFLYLNVLDASFSLDGVIGAFALTNNMIIIAIGLSVGAIFVRSLTLMLVRHGTLDTYHYLEHGAFWAILALGIIMLISTLVAVPEAITGLVGAGLIAAAALSSRNAGAP